MIEIPNYLKKLIGFKEKDLMKNCDWNKKRNRVLPSKLYCKRELKPLDNINDHNLKYLLTTDYTPYISHNGIKQNVFEWLLDK